MIGDPAVDDTILDFGPVMVVQPTVFNCDGKQYIQSYNSTGGSEE